MISNELKQRIKKQIDDLCIIAGNHFDRQFTPPTISYNVGGTTAGKAWPNKNQIGLNPVLLSENVEDFFKRTIPHELAHIVTSIVYPETLSTRYGKRDLHGIKWMSIMYVLGVSDDNISRCHSYDVTNSARSARIFECKCERCGETTKVTARKHANIQRAMLEGNHYQHIRCGGKILPVEATSKQPALPVKQLPQPAVSTSTSKLDMCMKIYAANISACRGTLIDMFVKQAGCTPAGASTYVAICKKKHAAIAA